MTELTVDELTATELITEELTITELTDDEFATIELEARLGRDELVTALLLDDAIELVLDEAIELDELDGKEISPQAAPHFSL